MTRHPSGLAILLSPLLLLAACGSSAQRHTTQLLNDRLQAHLTDDVKAGNAALQPVPSGALVTLLSTSAFPNGKRALDDNYSDIRSAVIEGMLDPVLMQVRVADTSTLPDDERRARVNNVKQYFAAYGLADVLQPAEPLQTAANGAPGGLTITINVQCPNRHDGTGYDSGLSHPICE